ncbi:hypothetical protein HUJ04_010246 [Dendroctonus ponderosae]|nr:hypothetical protein HUJ04_010246 [Dendroctonus ponderosae]
MNITSYFDLLKFKKLLLLRKICVEEQFISAYESTDWLTCNSQGEITTKTDQIDADTNKVYNITIKCNATDGFFITSQDFNIYVMDTNNQFPQVMVNNTLPKLGKSAYESTDWLTCNSQGEITTKTDQIDADTNKVYNITIKCNATDGFFITSQDCTFNQSDLCYESFIIVDSEILVLVGGNDLNRDENLPKYDCMLTCFDNPNREQRYEIIHAAFDRRASISSVLSTMVLHQGKGVLIVFACFFRGSEIGYS